ncbi:hypothetical protein GLOIN_2v1513366 [Rhizophagus irregularis DAOM 181602=DAOM 197198]|uniref:SAM domain-containing protein n=1 Tax=Rhizophagus irregularis (strain DAOM 181602 / DAOM 197198 / MUCL 43194) TaxID=747089 RepID=A0A2P4QTI7_RHIID|nr:hypothetical protein GLOIN_2v1513366 [Rhizophagus irregularis DAOM 181602=DAOM 197198]POG80868.1 hypothetical protein GLOIN_2v1513366 [Rhizophagus irregularis DAOM 181602=DAOM 197198]|eukprot:XP_025187734.1 hypothetical protein GLOIN_2v1513366 [Rhizophagus irregularis DAOM 181602=DAOM 197198]
MSTSTVEHNSYLVENWDTETLINFLKEQNLKLDDDDLGILRKKKIARLAKEVQALKEKLKRVFSSYKSLSEVLAKYGIDGNGTDTIPLFSLQSLKNYGTLVMDSLEAMRNEYIVAILHSAINITRDDTGKELSMRPEYEVIGEESSGQVDYAIKDVENLICITEDKSQWNVIEGFAQNIKQLESSYETNKRKISQGSKLPLSIEFSKDALDKKSAEYQKLCNGVKKVLSVVVGIIKDRACVEEEPDRKKARVEARMCRFCAVVTGYINSEMRTRCPLLKVWLFFFICSIVKYD